MSNQKEDRRSLMLNSDLKTLLFKMSVPTVVAQLITTVYNLVDTYFVSTLGTNATAAVGVNSSLERVITLFGSLIGAGACSYIARLLGAKRDEDADRTMSTSFFSGLGIGLILLVLGQIFMEPMINLLGATDECRVYSIQYASYVLYAAPFMITSLILNMCLRSEGSATYSMIGIGFGGVLNCILDPIFIFVLNLGVAGASMATAISKFVSFCILLWPYVRKSTVVTISIRKFKPVLEDIVEVIKIGSASFFRLGSSILATVLLNRMAGSYSTAALAAISVANRIMEFPFAIVLGFGQGYQPVVGYNWGAQQYRRVKQSLRIALTISLVGAVIMGLIFGVGARWIVPLFNTEEDAEVLRLGIRCIRLQCLMLWSHTLCSTINMFYAGLGRAKRALAISLSRQGYCYWPVLVLAPMFLGAESITAVQAIADALTLIVVVPMIIDAFRILDRQISTQEE